MEKDFVAIQVASPDGSRPPTRWALSRRALYAIVTGLLILVALLGFLLTRVADLARRSAEVERLLSRNAALEEEVQKVHQLEDELAAVRRMDQQMRSLLGLAPDVDEEGYTASAGDEQDGLSVEERELVATPKLDAAEAGLDPTAVARARSFVWPVEGWISSEFGEQRPGRASHSGIDIVAPSGTPVIAAADGVVMIAGSDRQYGRLLVIDHGEGVHTLYGHNAELLVRRGDVVTRGGRVALVGSTGQSTAPHLHFEVRQGDYAFDPRVFLPKRDGMFAEDPPPG